MRIFDARYFITYMLLTASLPLEIDPATVFVALSKLLCIMTKKNNIKIDKSDKKKPNFR